MRGILKTTASERVKGIFQEKKGFRSTQKETKTSVTSIWKMKRKDGLDLRFKFSDISVEDETKRWIGFAFQIF